MARKSSKSNDWGVMELAREKPFAATAVAAGAAAAGLFLWSKRSQISDQLSGLSDQFGQWTEGMRSGSFGNMDDTAGLTASGNTSPAGRTASGSRSSSRQRGMSETGSGNAGLGRRSSGGGMARSTSGRRRVQAQPTNPQ